MPLKGKTNSGAKYLVDNYKKFERTPAIESIVLLPGNRVNKAGFSYTSHKLAVSAHIQNGITRKNCQDTLVVAISNKGVLLGVFDGFGETGDIASEIMGESVLYSFQRNIVNGGISVFASACNQALKRFRRKNSGVKEGSGTTASVVMIYPTGRYMVCAVGDSPVYVIEDYGNKVTRLLNTHETALIQTGSAEPNKPVCKKIPLLEAMLSPQQYRIARHFMESSITKEGIRDIEFAEGELSPDSKIIVASDGLSKNLKLSLGNYGQIVDVSGCNDIKEIICGKNECESVLERIVTKITMLMSHAVSSPNPGFSFDACELNEIRIPQDDDLSVIVLEYKRAEYKEEKGP